MCGYQVRIHDMPSEDRPRERLLKHGPGFLSNAELLSVILRTGSKDENVVSMSSRILSEYNLKQLSQANITQLTEDINALDDVLTYTQSVYRIK